MSEVKEFENWINLYGQKIFDQAYFLLLNKEDAEDIVQEVFISAFSGMETFKNMSSPFTWLIAILHHKTADHYKRKYRFEKNISFDHFFNEDLFWRDTKVANEWENEDLSLLDNISFNEYLQKCLEQLPQRWLLLVKLTYLEENKFKEIRQKVDISAANYWKILQRCRLQLRECIEYNWFENER